MRKITAIAVALGFLTSVSLPAYATSAVSGVVKSDDLSAKKKKSKKMEKKDEKKDDKKMEKKDEKKSALGTDLSAKKKKKKDEKKDDKKMDKMDKKDEKKSEILYRIAA